ncbi:MAG TPA: HAD family hydrolase [Acidobacteriota bacterium]|nr:HAD family hydrolase [Acidobacteriota bacterium]
MIRLITFDFWNTLFIDRDEEIRSEMRKSFALARLRRYKRRLRKDEVDHAFQAAQDEFEQQWQRYTASRMEVYVSTICRELKIEVKPDDHKEIVDFFETVLLTHQPVLVPSAAVAIQSAKSRMKVGLVCDTGFSPGTTLRKIMDANGIASYFDSFSFSNETGYLKPRIETFGRVLNDLRIRPEEAVHIGDLEHTDIAGAKRIGMKAIKFIGANHSATRESIADIVLERLSDLPSALDRLQYNKG